MPMIKVSSLTDMVVPKDEWVTAAMMNNQMVVELLLRLKQGKTTAAENSEALLPPFRWGVRQRRSSSRYSASVDAVPSVKKEADSVRGSPMTPLSWSDGSGSGGGSASPSSAATADGFEETSRQVRRYTSAGSGSKAFPAATNEITSSFSKRSKKKKAFSELQDEEHLLLKERLNLEKEIATMRTTIKEQSARNVSLKKIKLDLNSGCVKSSSLNVISSSNLEQATKRSPSSIDQISLPKPDKKEPISDACREGRSNGGFSFTLPDLNMSPSEDDVRMS